MIEKHRCINCSNQWDKCFWTGLYKGFQIFYESLWCKRWKPVKRLLNYNGNLAKGVSEKIEIKTLMICGDCGKEAQPGCVNHHIFEIDAIKKHILHSWLTEQRRVNGQNTVFDAGFNSALNELEIMIGETDR